MSALVTIALGANLPRGTDSPRDTLALAMAEMSSSESPLIGPRFSRIYRSTPVLAEGPDFANAVAVGRSDLSPLALLKWLHGIEVAFGRRRSTSSNSFGPSAARTLDLDLIDVEGVAMNTSDLTLPHPRASQRAFVMIPWAELDPNRLVALLPGVQQRVSAWAAACPTDAALSPWEGALA
jgi:2-amino-4-hydroxy-6-hydroxymethyldihydropteridine diphosphokinase